MTTGKIMTSEKVLYLCQEVIKAEMINTRLSGYKRRDLLGRVDKMEFLRERHFFIQKPYS